MKPSEPVTLEQRVVELERRLNVEQKARMALELKVEELMQLQLRSSVRQGLTLGRQRAKSAADSDSGYGTPEVSKKVK